MCLCCLRELECEKEAFDIAYHNITDTGPEQSQIAVAFLSDREQNHKFVLCFLFLEPFMERGETLGMEIRYLSIGFKICYLPENFYQFFEVNNASKSSNTF